MCIYPSLCVVQPAIPAWAGSRWTSQGKCWSPEKGFTLRVLPRGAAPLSLAGWDEFKLRVLHGSWASRTRVKYGMRLTGNNPRKARGPLCLEYSPDLRSVAFFRHKWTRRIENYNLLCCFGGRKKPQQSKTQQYWSLWIMVRKNKEVNLRNKKFRLFSGSQSRTQASFRTSCASAMSS